MSYISFLSLLVVLVFMTSFGFSQGKDDYEFANGLIQVGYLDLAKEVFSEIKANTKASGEERAKGELGLIRVLKAEAEKEPDPDKQQDAFDKAIKALKGFIQTYSTLKEAKDARYDLGILLQTKGKYLTKQAQKTGDTKYREIAAEALKESIELFKSTIEAEKGKVKVKKGGEEGEEGEEGEGEEATEDFLKSSCYYFESMYYLGICYDKSSTERTTHLKKAITLIEEFAWQNEGGIAAYYAYMTQGHCYIALDKFDEAITAYDTVCSLPNDKEYAGAKSIRQRGFLAKAEGCNSGERFNDALKTTQQYLSDYPGEEERHGPIGLGILLEQAKSYAGIGDIGNALTLAQEISDQGGFWGREAQYFIGTLPIGGKVPTKTAFSVAEGHRKRSNLGKAIDSYQQAVDGGESEEDFKTLIPKAWYNLGACYFEEGLYDAAAEVWTQGSELKKGDKELLAENAYWAMRAFQEMKNETKNKDHEEAYKKARTAVTSRFADSKFVKDGTLQFLEGKDLIKANKFDESVAVLGKMSPDSPKYERAQVEIGVCYYKQGTEAVKGKNDDTKSRDKYFKMAKDQFKKCFDYAENNPLTDAEKQSEREASLANAKFYAASMSADLKEWDEVHKYAEEFVNHPVYSKQRNLVAALYHHQVKAYCKQKEKNTEKAIELFEKTKADPTLQNSGYLEPMAKLIGINLNNDLSKSDENLKKWKKELESASGNKKKDLEEKIAQEQKKVKEQEPLAAEYLYYALSNEKKPDPPTANTVGNLLYKLKDFDKAAQMYKIAYKENKDPKERANLEVKLASCLVASQRWFEALPIYRELFKRRSKDPVVMKELAQTYVGVCEQASIPKAKTYLLEYLKETLKEEMDQAQSYRVDDQKKYITLRYPDYAEKLERDEQFNKSPLKTLERIHEKRLADAETSEGASSEKYLREYLWREALQHFIYLSSFLSKQKDPSDSPTEITNPDWWEAKYMVPFLYEKLENKVKAKTIIEQVQQLFPDLGEKFGYKTKFDSLLQRLKS
jgi:tetratricopeptide (TPR) repeat protein